MWSKAKFTALFSCVFLLTGVDVVQGKVHSIVQLCFSSDRCGCGPRQSSQHCSVMFFF